MLKLLRSLLVVVILANTMFATTTLKKFIGFTDQAIGDGSATRIVVCFATDPIMFNIGTGTALLTSVFQSLPSDVRNISVSGATVSGTPSYSVLTHELTIDLTSAPADGTIVYVSGYAEYP